MNIYLNAGAMDVASIGMAVTANNIANMNTDGFHASSARYATGPGGQGVQLAEIREDASPGAPVWHPSSFAVEASNTDLNREMVNMIVNERLYQANAAAISTYEGMLGTVLDIVT